MQGVGQRQDPTDQPQHLCGYEEVRFESRFEQREVSGSDFRSIQWILRTSIAKNGTEPLTRFAIVEKDVNYDVVVMNGMCNRKHLSSYYIGCWTYRDILSLCYQKTVDMKEKDKGGEQYRCREKGSWSGEAGRTTAKETKDPGRTCGLDLYTDVRELDDRGKEKDYVTCGERVDVAIFQLVLRSSRTVDSVKRFAHEGNIVRFLFERFSRLHRQKNKDMLGLVLLDCSETNHIDDTEDGLASRPTWILESQRAPYLSTSPRPLLFESALYGQVYRVNIAP